MKSILIRDLDESTLAALKRLARYHNRSLQGELHDLLERAAKSARLVETPGELDLVTTRTGGDTSWPRSEMYAHEER